MVGASGISADAAIAALRACRCSRAWTRPRSDRWPPPFDHVASGAARRSSTPVIPATRCSSWRPGQVKITLPPDDGSEPAILTTIGPGGFFGELALLDGAPRSATAVAIDAVTTLVLRRDAFDTLVDEQPALRHALLAALAAEIRRLTAQVEDLHFLDLPGRLARHLLREIARRNGAGSTTIPRPPGGGGAPVVAVHPGRAGGHDRRLTPDGEPPARRLRERTDCCASTVTIWSSPIRVVWRMRPVDDRRARRAPSERPRRRCCVRSDDGWPRRTGSRPSACRATPAGDRRHGGHGARRPGRVGRAPRSGDRPARLRRGRRAGRRRCRRPDHRGQRRGIAGYAFSTGQPLAVADVAQDPRFDRTVAESTGYVPRSLLATPLVDDAGDDRRPRGARSSHAGRSTCAISRSPDRVRPRGDRHRPRRVAPSATRPASCAAASSPSLEAGATTRRGRCARGGDDRGAGRRRRRSGMAAGRPHRPTGRDRPGPDRSRGRLARRAAPARPGTAAGRVAGPDDRAAPGLERGLRGGPTQRPGASRSPSAVSTAARSSATPTAAACGSRSSTPGWMARIRRSVAGWSARCGSSWTTTRRTSSTIRRRAMSSATARPAPGSSPGSLLRPS